jgi:ubiquinone/menaquinone biosynthesis C-methylase UbiE
LKCALDRVTSACRLREAFLKGYLLLIDIQREVVAKAKNWIKKAGVKNFSCTQSDANNLPLANGTFGVVFLVAVLGKVMDRQSCLREIF